MAQHEALDLTVAGEYFGFNPEDLRGISGVQREALAYLELQVEALGEEAVTDEVFAKIFREKQTTAELVAGGDDYGERVAHGLSAKYERAIGDIEPGRWTRTKKALAAGGAAVAASLIGGAGAVAGYLVFEGHREGNPADSVAALERYKQLHQDEIKIADEYATGEERNERLQTSYDAVITNAMNAFHTYAADYEREFGEPFAEVTSPDFYAKPFNNGTLSYASVSYRGDRLVLITSDTDGEQFSLEFKVAIEEGKVTPEPLSSLSIRRTTDTDGDGSLEITDSSSSTYEDIYVTPGGSFAISTGDGKVPSTYWNMRAIGLGGIHPDFQTGYNKPFDYAGLVEHAKRVDAGATEMMDSLTQALR